MYMKITTPAFATVGYPVVIDIRPLTHAVIRLRRYPSIHSLESDPQGIGWNLPNNWLFVSCG